MTRPKPKGAGLLEVKLNTVSRSRSTDPEKGHFISVEHVIASLQPEATLQSNPALTWREVSVLLQTVHVTTS